MSQTHRYEIWVKIHDPLGHNLRLMAHPLSPIDVPIVSTTPDPYYYGPPRPAGPENNATEIDCQSTLAVTGPNSGTCQILRSFNYTYNFVNL